jgi:hypothetical protein
MSEPQWRSLQVIAHAGAKPTAIDNPPDGADGDVDYTDGCDEWRAQSVIQAVVTRAPPNRLPHPRVRRKRSAHPRAFPDSAVFRPVARKLFRSFAHWLPRGAIRTPLSSCARPKPSRQEH